MKNAEIIFIDGVGYCKVITKHHITKEGLKLPYDIYEPIN